MRSSLPIYPSAYPPISRAATSLARASIAALLLSTASFAQIPAPSPGVIATPDDSTQEETGPTLGEVIGAIAENEKRNAVDFHQLAELTLQLGQAAMQQGQRIPDPSIWDGIHAVDKGELIDPLQTDWDTLRSELEKLLEKPPESEDQQPQDQDSEDQDQEEQQDNQEQENDSDEQDSESGENNEDSQSSEDESGESSPEEQSEEGGESEQGDQQEGENQQSQQNENLGDMDDPEQTPDLDQRRPEEKEEQTQVGGTEKQQPPRSAKQAMTLQQLEQLKQQDKPGALHMLLQNMEQSDDPPPPQKNLKDW